MVAAKAGCGGECIHSLETSKVDRVVKMAAWMGDEEVVVVIMGKGGVTTTTLGIGVVNASSKDSKSE